MDDEFKKQFPSIKLLVKPRIVTSAFDDIHLSIVYPHTYGGKWMHMDEIQKYCLDKQKVLDILNKYEGVDSAEIYIQIIKEELGLL